jgi:hypothetical protein
MITGSNLLRLAVTYRSRLTQFSKLFYTTVRSKVLLQSVNSGRISWSDAISYISEMFELRRFEMVVGYKEFNIVGLQIQVYM